MNAGPEGLLVRPVQHISACLFVERWARCSLSKLCLSIVRPVGGDGPRLDVLMLQPGLACHVLNISCRQQLSTMQERWNALEAEAAAARQEAEEAQAAAGKADADLAALSTAYNDLEEHAFKMEEQLKQQEQAGQVQQQQGPVAAGGVPEPEVQARIQAALEQVGWIWLGAG